MTAQTLAAALALPTALLLILAEGRESDRGGDPHCSRKGWHILRKCIV
ncbi:hypothetical protein KPSA1_00733 [Pseudomonas syringae pv. actinidiae]|uniref:Uncharacterized protein n=1 Tax=Pseudomonas syringae pv. actinidiae TaxID=103796 RepID=A0A2V0QFL5_PSESF|nr:hypothetical protein KPSA1_00733 [Pseudomonas syringae pv. actinidiae]